MTIFEPFPKLSRLSRGCVITEKLDGTNAQIVVVPYTAETADALEPGWSACINDPMDGSGLVLYAGSRTRLITPGKTTDNYGFAGWVADNAEELAKLGPGRHYGEWYGQGIQRNYGLTEKRFALFNPERWPPQRVRPACVELVPVLHDGEFSTGWIDHAMYTLKLHGSRAVQGYDNPEGVVIWHSASRVSFKKTFDDNHKEAA